MAESADAQKTQLHWNLKTLGSLPAKTVPEPVKPAEKPLDKA